MKQPGFSDRGSHVWMLSCRKILGSSFCPSVRRGPSFVRDPSGVVRVQGFFQKAMKDVVRDHEII